MRVAESATTAAHEHHPLLPRHKVGHEVAACCVEDRRTRRHSDDQVRSGLSVRLLGAARAAIAGSETTLVFEIAEGREAWLDHDVDAPPAPTIATIGAAARNVRLAAHGRGAVATTASRKVQLYDVEEHRAREGTAPGCRRRSRFHAANHARP